MTFAQAQRLERETRDPACNECGAPVTRGRLSFWIHADRITRDHLATPEHRCIPGFWSEAGGRVLCRGAEGCRRSPTLSETYAD